MEYKDVKDAKYADDRKRSINCWVKFNDFSFYVPFTACPEDVEPHAKRILRELKEGKYGEIGDFNGDT